MSIEARLYTSAVEAAVADGFVAQEEAVAEPEPVSEGADTPAVSEEAAETAPAEESEGAVFDAVEAEDPAADSPSDGDGGHDTIPVDLSETPTAIAVALETGSEPVQPESQVPVTDPEPLAELEQELASEIEVDSEPAPHTVAAADPTEELDAAEPAVAASIEAVGEQADLDVVVQQGEAAAEAEWSEAPEGIVPLVLPGPPAEQSPETAVDAAEPEVEAEVSADGALAGGVASPDEEELFESTGDPDFDALLRGDGTA